MADMRLCTLYSGSSANCTYIEAGGHAVLIDAGAGVRNTEHALSNISRSYSDIDGIFITHEHSDHIAGLTTIMKKRKIPVFGNERTLDAVAYSLQEVPADVFNVMPTGMTAKGRALSVTSFRSSHDSVESVGYVIIHENKKIGYLTDTGVVTEEMISFLAESDAVVIESNHDIGMLRSGPYPYSLKRRVGGDFGHLSNKACLEVLKELYAYGTRKAILAHLSKENNSPDLAYLTVKSGLVDSGMGDMDIYVAPRSCVSEVIEL